MDLKVLFLLLGSSFLISLVSGNQAIDNKDFAVDHIENERRVNEERKSNSERVCANGCTGHGDCVNGACSCWFGWTGSDCSIYEQAVSSGQLYANQSVSTFNWRYYYITSTSNRDIIAEVTQTSNGDCDMYVQLNDLPTRSDYLYRNITTDSTFEVTVPAAQSGTWYFGIYGFSACTYQIRITIASLCPANCNGHGTCMSGQCRCYAGYTGTDCGTAVNVLAVNTPVSGSLALHEFVVYQFTMQSGNLMVFAVQETGDGDCDLYLKFEGIPSTTSWDYANVTTHDFSSLSVTDPQFGDWYLEIYGYSACSYILTAVVEVGCPNNCSNRGSCGSGNCNCPTGYTGDYCQTRTAPLVDGQPDSGYVDSNNWNYYSFVTDTTNNFVIQVTQITGDGDCDLYVRAGQIPTRFNYDYFDLSVNPTFSLTIEDPGQQTWYIGIFGWEECSYTITASETSNCPDTGCSNHGTCQTNGVCLCNAQWTGAACEYQMVPLGNKVAIGGTVNYNTWNFYSFQIDGTSSLNILVKETSTTGLLWVYVAKTYPTIHEYLYSETGSGNIHRISIDFDDEENAVYQIGIYGNPYLLAGQSVSYQIVAYAPDF